MRDCIFVCTEPSSGAAAQAPSGAGAGAGGWPDTAKLAVPWHFDQVGLFGGLTHDGIMPTVDLKVSWYLSDHDEPGHGCTIVVPGR